MTVESTPLLSEEERKKILRTLEEDREFRYAVMGLLGYAEVLNRITKLEERFAELGERFAKLEEGFVKLEERVTKLEERIVKLEERFAKLEERFAELEKRFADLEERFIKLEERVAKLEERVIKLEERVANLEERMLRVEEELRNLGRTVVVIAHRFGILTESGFREAMRYVVEEVLGVAKVGRWVYRDVDGFVYGYPSQIEVDVAVKDGVHILIEVKSRVSRADVYELYRIGLLYERVYGVKPRLVVIGGFIDANAYEAAAKLGVEVRPIFKE